MDCMLDRNDECPGGIKYIKFAFGGCEMKKNVNKYSISEVDFIIKISEDNATPSIKRT